MVVFNRPVDITAHAERWPEFAWNVPVLKEPSLAMPYYAMSREDQRIEYSMAADGFQRHFSSEISPSQKRVIRLIITKQSIAPHYQSRGNVGTLFRAWLIPSKYSHAKHSRLIGEWRFTYPAFIFPDVDKEVLNLVGDALRGAGSIT